MKTVIISGASGNLGLAVTKNFLDKGYRVIATAANESEKNALSPLEHVDVQVVNLMQEEEAYAFVESNIKKYGAIDAALLLVGGFAAGNIASTSGADLHKQFSLNFETAYFITRPLFQHMMEKNRGNLVFIGARPAINAVQGHGLLAYSLSKSLLFKLAEFLNEEAKGRNVSVAVVVPSTLDTLLNRKSMPEADPSNWVRPEQVAEILEFIISEKGGPLRETIVKVYNNA
ncbi:MAG: SDR family NAD(P)-dependent oxidoreductase [Bacteroidota bacterium]|nr:SDR family NAD(P)-dependent oxidoreductase [Bacteroidota bacterium]MDP4213468.1 SDR family NAD(P)-dependent oxidoreductase [Bacteroidota bacterium]